MKHYLLLLSILCFSACAFGSKPTQTLDSGQLYDIAHQYFTGSDKLKDPQVITANWLKSATRITMYHRMRSLLNSAMDTQQDIRDLQEFGLIDQDNGHYVIDYARQPQWVTIRSLFLSFHTEQDLDDNSYHLHANGLSTNDLTLLRAYLKANNPQIIVDKTALEINKKPPSTHQQPNVSMVQRSDYQIWDHWGIKLLNTLTPDKQQILVSYLQQNLGSVGFAAGGRFIVDFSSGLPKQIYSDAQPTGQIQLNIAVNIQSNVLSVGGSIGYKILCEGDRFANKRVEYTGTSSHQLIFKMDNVQPLGYPMWPITTAKGHQCQLQWTAFVRGVINPPTAIAPYFSIGNIQSLLTSLPKIDHPKLANDEPPAIVDFVMQKSHQNKKTHHLLSPDDRFIVSECSPAAKK